MTGTAGDITVNEKPLEKAFPRLTLRQIIQLPLEMAGLMGKYSISATVYGGGPTGQAGALRHAIARALVAIDPHTRSPLKKEGLLTRDSRVKERKKYGQKRGAQALPVLQALSAGADDPKREGSMPSLFLCPLVCEVTIRAR